MRKIFILLISFGIVFAVSSKMSVYDGTGGTESEKQKVIYTQSPVSPPATDMINWVPKASSPAPGRYWCPGTGVVRDTIWFLGGAINNAGNHTSTDLISAYVPENNTWVTSGLPNLLTPRRAGGGGKIGNKIYVVGGRDATSPYPNTLSSCEEFDVDAKMVTAKASMPAPKWAVASAVANGKLYIIGDDDKTGTTYEYNPASTWTTMTPLPIGRGWAAATEVNGKIYVFGGQKLGGDILNDCWMFDPDANTWTQKASMPGPRLYHSACAFNNAEIYVMGGTPVEFGIADNSVYKYNIANDIWTVETPMLTPRGWLMANQVGDKIYATYGSSCLIPPSYLTVNEEATFITFDNDVGVERIISPGANHLVNSTMTPQALVVNYGRLPQTDFTVSCEIYAGDELRWSNTKQVALLTAGSAITISFDNWTPAITEICNVKIKTHLSGDQDETNDKKEQTTNIIDYVIVGTGTSFEGEQPMERYCNYSTHEAIYLQSEINVAGNIAHLAYYKDQGANVGPIENVKIYMKHTTATTLSTENYNLTGYTQVFYGSFTNNATEGWMDIALTTPFAYNNTGNLQILVIKGYQDWIFPYIDWRYTLTSPYNRSRGNFSDYIQPTNLYETDRRPNLRLLISEQIPNTYILAMNTVGFGSVIKYPNQQFYENGTVVDLTAIPAPGWTFSNWSGDLTGSANPITITMDGNKTVTATFTAIQYTLTINIVGSGSVTKSPNRETYTYGNIVTLQAFPASGWIFSGWSGGLTGTANPVGITIKGDTTITATFTQNQYTLTINTVGNGSVIKNPNQATYTYGTVVELTANPATGWHFTGWSGDLTGNTNPTSITMDGNKNVTATFTINTYTIVSSATSGGIIQPLGTIYLNYGGSQSYTMTANMSYRIDSVYVDNVNQGTISSYTFNNVLVDHTIAAFFSIFPWIRKENMPSGLPMSYVDAGGAMVGVGDILYALRGNGTREFYRYNGTQWQSRANTSSFVSEGGALCYDGVNTIYALRGGGAKNYWAYSISSNRWSNKASAPVAINNGSSIAYLDGKVYLLAGGRKLGDLNFFAYNTNNNKWTNLTSSPTSPDNKTYGAGSCIVELSGQIYALKGSGDDNYFWVYNATSNIWTAQPSIPSVHPQRGVATTVLDGGAMTSNGEIYAIKGGSSNEFWKYTPALPGAWTPLDTIPRLNALSVPYSGAALAYANNKVWLLKGNNLPEFWQFIPAAYRGEKTASNLNNNSVQSLNAQGTKLSAEIKVLPNPINKQATIRYTVPMPNNVTIKLYDATGRVVEVINDGRMNTGSYTANLSAKNLAKGVYFLRYNDTQNQKEIKVIIE